MADSVRQVLLPDLVPKASFATSKSFSLATSRERMELILDFGWEVLIKRIQSGRTKINKESSLQLHYGSILQNLGELLCVDQGETFFIELETSHQGKNIDIVCTLGNVPTAIELKCFRKQSNRASDTDMCDVLKDFERLIGFEGFTVRRFFCLTDNPYYMVTEHTGHAASVSIRDGTIYKAGQVIQPSWKGRWKDKSRDNPITFSKDVPIQWREGGGWYWLAADLS